MSFLINQHVTAGTKFNSYLSKSPYMFRMLCNNTCERCLAVVSAINNTVTGIDFMTELLFCEVFIM